MPADPGDNLEGHCSSPAQLAVAKAAQQQILVFGIAEVGNCRDCFETSSARPHQVG